MSRAASFWIRTVVLVVGMLLLAAGAVALGWHLDLAGARERIGVPGTADWPEAGWWPWALGGAAAFFALVGLGVPVALAIRRRPGTRSLHGSGPDGALSADLEAAASAGAQCFAALDGVRSARYRLRRRRGVPTIELILQCTPDVDADVLAQASRINALALYDSFGEELAQRVFVRCDPVSG